MEKKHLSFESREISTKSVITQLRANDRIPCVVYGSGENKHISISGKEFRTEFKTVTENTIIELSDGKDSYQVLVKDYQNNLLYGKIMHIDFMEIQAGKLLRTRVPVKVDGNAPGVREGGILEVLLEEIEVECLPKNMPERIHVNVDELQIHQSIHVRDLDEIADVKVLDAEDAVVVTIAGKGSEVAIEGDEEAEEEEAVEGEEE